MQRKYKTLLASKSPRRIELLKMIYDTFDVIPSSINEKKWHNLFPVEAVMKLAYAKAEDISKLKKDCLVIGADTAVSLNNKMQNQPKDYLDGINMLYSFSGKKIFVFTGVALLFNSNIVSWFVETSAIYFSRFSRQEVVDYISSDSPLDKAGAFGVQDDFCKKNIEYITGDYNNIIGLPVTRLRKAILNFDSFHGTV